MLVLGWVITVLWILGAVVCGLVGHQTTSEWVSPYASPVQRILYHVAEGRADAAWFLAGLSVGMAMVTAICTMSLATVRRLAADLASLRLEAIRDRQERQSDAAAVLERLPIR